MYLSFLFQIPKRVHHMNPDLKLILILRDPIERIISNQAFDRFRYGCRVKSLDVQLIDSQGNLDTTHSYIKISTYHTHLRNWYRLFSPQQLLVLSSEQFTEQPQPVLAEVEQFLGVSHELTDSMFYYDEHKGFYCYIQNSNHTCMSARKGIAHGSMSSELLQKLRIHFRPLNLQLFTLLNRTFDWPNN